ncbi:MAG TPA: hypothetical protein VGD81_20675 [Opitutaceae bacterium]
MTTRWKVWLAAFGIFAAGLAAGSLITVGLGARALRRALQAPADAARVTPIDRAVNRIHDELTDELGLTPEQSASVRAELAHSASEVKRLRVETVAQVRRTLETAVHRIGARLTTEQRTKLDELTAKRFARVGWTYTPAPAEKTIPGK